jgi:hypothetical protein
MSNSVSHHSRKTGLFYEINLETLVTWSIESILFSNPNPVDFVDKWRE